MDENDMTTRFSSINSWLYNILFDMGISEQWIIYVKLTILIVFLVIGVFLLQFITRKILTFLFEKLSKATPLSFFKYTIKNRMPHFLALTIPYSFVRGAIPIIFEDFREFINPLIKLTDIYLVFMVIWTIVSFIRTIADTFQHKKAFQNRPFRSYIQVIQIILFIIGLIFIYSILTGKSATGFFAAMGAASAVLMLMFKDTIMGFVASIQLSTNNMLQIGDWITMSKYGADGTVEEINLTTVKVENFDKTITTIPTYALISDSFQNWRGMTESGGRRFTRSLFIKQSKIRFMQDSELEKMKKIEALTEYIEEKQGNEKTDNKKQLFSQGGSKITNNDLFMQYAKWYLRNHSGVGKNFTLLVRQLAPTSQGLPVQLYAFTNTVIWSEYEAIISEILNHLISSVKYFDLSLFEDIAGSDLYNISKKTNEST